MYIVYVQLVLQDFREEVATHEDQFELLRAEGGRGGEWAEYLVPEDLQSELPSDESQPQSPCQGAYMYMYMLYICV